MGLLTDTQSNRINGDRHDRYSSLERANCSEAICGRRGVIGKTMQALAEIREMRNKVSVLGKGRFKRKGAEQLEWRVGPSAKGGNRRSEEHHKRV